ncbi:MULTISPECIES: hypothetical protein [Pantoea]|uniref:hypothetical protein n=1 Tax=Pantoea TaxID=53335 RepID=UPI001CC1E4E9|nr:MULTISPECIES: hypothetical protein [Pantoea]
MIVIARLRQKSGALRIVIFPQDARQATVAGNQFQFTYRGNYRFEVVHGDSPVTVSSPIIALFISLTGCFRSWF